MGKRTVVSFLIFCIFVFTLVIRLYAIAMGGISSASSQNSTKSVTVGTSRGMIYDRNMLSLVCGDSYDLACVLPTSESIAKLKSSLTEDEFNQYFEKLREGSLVTFKTQNSSLASCSDIAVLKIYNRYSENQLAPHVIGYMTSDSAAGAYGAEKSFDGILSQNSGSLELVYSTDALGRVLSGADAEIRNTNYASKAGVVLTIDSTVQKIVEDVLKNANMETGAAVVLDAETGEILALASVPDFDPNNIAASLKDTNAPFVNRAITNYSVGSVFKLVVAAAAIESGIPLSSSYRCTGSCTKSGTLIYCHNRSGHGTVDMEKAFSVSCNTYFIDLALKLDKSTLTEYARALGFSQGFELMEGYYSDTAQMPDTAALDSDAAVANFAFGQGSLYATPLHLAACYLAAINGGTYLTPTLFKGTVDENGVIIQNQEKSLPKKVLRSETSQILKEFLFTTIEEGTGKPAKSDYYLCGGKTATAQTGRLINDKEILNSWFVGFYPFDKPKYVISIIKENGESGAADTAPVFKEICENIFFSQSSNPN